jgi:cell division protein FtsQ
MTQPNDSTPTNVVGEPAENQASDHFVDNAVTEPIFTGTGEDQTGADHEADQEADRGEVEGPRRRARRERAERRAAQARATTIEEARREAKRQVGGRLANQPKPVGRGVVRGLKMLLATILLVIIGIGLALVLYFTPAMSARNIVVVGTGVVTREEVLDAARVRFGTPLLQINTNQVADRVAAIRRVASARVQRQYPSALRISIVERVPVAVKDFPDGPHLFDRDGVDFATGPPPPAGLGNHRPHRREGREAGRVVDPARPHLRRVQPRPADGEIASFVTSDGPNMTSNGTRPARPEKCPKICGARVGAPASLARVVPIPFWLRGTT